LTSGERTRLTKPDAANAEAYQLYLKGRYHENQISARGYRRSIDFFQQAIEKDPDYALAYASLAEAYNGLGPRLYVTPRGFSGGEGSGNEGA
jgi:adenylate cyclase